MTTAAQPGAAPDDGRGPLRELRLRLLGSLALVFVIAMLLAGPLAGGLEASGSSAWLSVLRWLAVAALLPVGLAVAARRVLEPARELHFAHDRLRQLYGQARLDSLIDPITGLGNHRAFQEELIRQLEGARRHHHPLALVLIDLDDLKRINDEHGHVGGDAILGAMGRLISSACRATDRGFRIGGDEFALLLPRSDVELASGVVTRLLASALNTEREQPGGQPFSFSAGLSAYPTPASDPQRLFRQADSALYWAKRHGRTDVQAYDPARHAADDDSRTTAELAAAVVDVTQRRALIPVYQTIFDLRTGEPVGYEGLVRLVDGSDFRSPEDLFRAAEATERTVELDMVCVELLAGGVVLSQAEHYLAFNISPRTLETSQFRVSDLLAILAPHHIRPDRVVIELTERESVEDVARLRENLSRCRAEGMRIAADDVGAGNAGLRLLSEIQFDIVKIDLSLVHQGAARASAIAVLRAIREIGRQSGAVVVAEGIETADQLAVVRALDLVAGQGYLLSVPSPIVRHETLDLDTLLEVHEASRRALGGFLDLDVA